MKEMSNSGSDPYLLLLVPLQYITMQYCRNNNLHNAHAVIYLHAHIIFDVQFSKQAILNRYGITF